MKSESVEVRLARIEEGIVHMHEKLDSLKRPFTDKLDDQEKKVDDQDKRLIRLERDRYWLFILSGGAFSAALAIVAIIWGPR
jgi:hypothetical protein